MLSNSPTLHTTKELTDSTLKVISSLFCECFTAPPRFELWSPQEAEDYLIKDMACDGTLVTAEFEGKIVGFAMGLPLNLHYLRGELVAHGADQESFYLASVGVSECTRGLGLGRLLITELIRQASIAGYESVSARTRADALAVNTLNDHLGFKQLGQYEGAMGGVIAQRYIWELRF